ncbi:H-NS histone family protein [Paraburkholderia strydomiana]|uniref:H-NS histone family protein n=1 Tax=Paraburkholderia strydomiana TaxID=1245417 RepID=UPI001BE6DDCF|nr:H-NS histone family protein [Paraburkholderia strydomiana]MBT2792994.1 H-NS histone family protein [Paraburkholderia strydomiana]
MAYQGIEIAQLRAQQEALNKQLAEARERETLLVLNEIVQKMGEYGITVSELTGRKVGVQSNEPEAKYRDPVSGSTWSGRGRAPAWIAGKDRDEFLTDKRAASHARAQGVLFSEGH